MSQGLQLPFGIQPVNPVPVDSWSGPYDGVSLQDAIDLANLTIPVEIRFQSMEVRLIVGGESRKFWYRDGVDDTDLIEFGLGPIGVTGATGATGPQGAQSGFKKITITLILQEVGGIEINGENYSYYTSNEENLFFGQGIVDFLGSNVFNDYFSFYEDSDGLIHIGSTINVGVPA